MLGTERDEPGWHSMFIASSIRSTWYILEVHPAGHVATAANEAEKASPVKLIQMQPFGAFGRLYLGGTESNIREGAQAAIAALESIEGRENKP